jgi:uncharacterized RDD family membrane protein YckC
MDQSATGMTTASTLSDVHAVGVDAGAGREPRESDVYRVLPRRAAALLIDMVIWIAIAVGMAIVDGQVSSIEPGIRPDGTEVISGRSYTINPTQAYVVTGLWFAYVIVAEALFGATLGKAIAELRVVRTSGARVGVIAAVRRQAVRFGLCTAIHFLSIGFFLPFIFIGESVVALADDRRQRPGDYLADTVVVRKRDVPAIKAAPVSDWDSESPAWMT